MDYKNFNKNIILSTLLAIGIVSALNYQMDAFDVFHTKNRFNTYKPDIDKNHRLSKIPAFKLTQEKVDAIWVGSSKTGWNSNEEYEKSILNKNIKNLALNGGSFYESITMAKNAILIHPEIKTIYFGIDFCKMSKAVEKADALKPTTNKLTKVDLPAFGAPNTATKPQ